MQPVDASTRMYSSSAPQPLQRRGPAGFSAPHVLHIVTSLTNASVSTSPQHKHVLVWVAAGSKAPIRSPLSSSTSGPSGFPTKTIPSSSSEPQSPGATSGPPINGTTTSGAAERVGLPPVGRESCSSIHSSGSSGAATIFGLGAAASTAAARRARTIFRMTGSHAPPPVGITTPTVSSTSSSISTWSYSSRNASRRDAVIPQTDLSTVAVSSSLPCVSAGYS